MTLLIITNTDGRDRAFILENKKMAKIQANQMLSGGWFNPRIIEIDFLMYNYLKINLP